jgi:hypothetical protein
VRPHDAISTHFLYSNPLLSVLWLCAPPLDISEPNTTYGFNCVGTPRWDIHLICRTHSEWLCGIAPSSRDAVSSASGTHQLPHHPQAYGFSCPVLPQGTDHIKVPFTATWPGNNQNRPLPWVLGSSGWVPCPSLFLSLSPITGWHGSRRRMGGTYTSVPLPRRGRDRKRRDTSTATSGSRNLRHWEKAGRMALQLFP